MPSPFMDEAFRLARLGVGRTSPNPAVGAVVVSGGEIAGRGFHTWEGVRHAELMALEEAGARARGSTLYVTLEPCSHHGRTPPCVDAVLAAGVAEVVLAAEDPNPRVSGAGLRRLREAGIAVQLLPEYEDEAVRLNESFIHFMRTGRPLVTLKSAMTLDGKIAAPEDNRGWITSERARAHVQQARHFSDAILTGAGTLLSDDCLLTDRTALPRSRPLLRIVLDSTARTPRNSRLMRSCANDVLIVTTSAAPVERRAALELAGARILTADGRDGRTDLHAVIELLAREKYLSLMIEAGSKVNWAALEAGLVDKILFYYAPKILGGLQSLPVAGGSGRQRRADAILLERVRLHAIPPDEFAVEAYVAN